MHSINLTESDSKVIVTITFEIPKTKINFIKKVQNICDAPSSELSKLFNLPIPVVDKLIQQEK